jgi:hypothetical protein
VKSFFSTFGLHRSRNLEAAMRSASLVVHALFAAALVVPVVVTTGCDKVVALNLKVVEPCDQKNQALNGVGTFEVSTTGGPDVTKETFSASQGAQPLAVGLGDAVTVTMRGFVGDIATSGPAVLENGPQAQGSTLPLTLQASATDQTLLVEMGKLDTFGKTTDATGACTAMTANATLKGRHGHTATFIPVLNKVLIFGGAVWNQGVEDLVPTAELFDPATGTFEDLGPLDVGRAYHTATALPDGRVLIAGGLGVINGALQALQTAEIFDPTDYAAGKPFHLILLKQARAHHTATFMKDLGLIVLVGGCQDTADNGCKGDSVGVGVHGPTTNLTTTVEVIDTKNAVLTSTAVASGLSKGRAFHEATSLDNGASSVLVVTGGVDTSGPICNVEVFQANQGVLARNTAAPGLLTFPTGKCPARHQAVALDGTRMAIIGGQTANSAGRPSGVGSKDVFFYSTIGGIATSEVKLLSGRAGHQAQKLSDGSLLVVGGIVESGGATAELIAPAAQTGALTARALAGPLSEARDRAASVLLPNGQVLVTGGHTLGATPVTSDDTSLYFGN